MNSFVLDPDQQKALDLMKSGANVFLTGKAGTGKSAVLGEFRDWCRENHTSCVFLAPTGVAALNIGGATIHSFLQLAPSLQTPDTIKDFRSGRANKARVVGSTRAIVIDEISMVRSDLFAAIDYRLRQLAYGSNRGKPFGGKQIIVVGDFFQLPPVVSTADVLALLQLSTEEQKQEFFHRWMQSLQDLSDNDLALFLPPVLGITEPTQVQVEAIRANQDLFLRKLREFIYSSDVQDRVDAFFEDLRHKAPDVNYGFFVAAEYLLEVKFGGVFSFQARQWTQDADNLWYKAGFQAVMLGISHRQEADKTFGAACDAVREGNLAGPFAKGQETGALDWLEQRVRAVIPNSSMRLCPTNAQVQDINEEEYRIHADDSRVFRATMTGKVLEKYERNVAEGKVSDSSFPTDIELKLWPGARVMLLKNERDGNGGYLYVNGSLGTVTGFTDHEGTVKIGICLDPDKVGGMRIVEVEIHRWPSYEYRLEHVGALEQVVAVENGSFQQYPLKLAYAVTIHKSQGLSLDAASIELGRGCFAPGQLYTALTRVRTFSGLSLDRRIEERDNKRDAAVVAFYQGLLPTN